MFYVKVIGEINFFYYKVLYLEIMYNNQENLKKRSQFINGYLNIQIVMKILTGKKHPFLTIIFSTKVFFSDALSLFFGLCIFLASLLSHRVKMLIIYTNTLQNIKLYKKFLIHIFEEMKSHNRTDINVITLMKI